MPRKDMYFDDIDDIGGGSSLNSDEIDIDYDTFRVDPSLGTQDERIGRGLMVNYAVLSHIDINRDQFKCLLDGVKDLDSSLSNDVRYYMAYNITCNKVLRDWIDDNTDSETLSLYDDPSRHYIREINDYFKEQGQPHAPMVNITYEPVSYFTLDEIGACVPGYMPGCIDINNSYEEVSARADEFVERYRSIDNDVADAISKTDISDVGSKVGFLGTFIAKQLTEQVPEVLQSEESKKDDETFVTEY